MNHLQTIFNRYYDKKVLVLTVVGILILSTAIAVWYLDSEKTEKLIIAAGPESSLSYEIVNGIKQFLIEDYGIAAEVVATRDGEENASLLGRGLVQLAVVSAKSLQSEQAKLVASLYPGQYHLLVHDDSNIYHFTNLKGKKIALQSKGSSEYEAFWEVAQHYGLSHDDITVYASTDKASDWVYEQHQVDAIFRIRAKGDTSIKSIVTHTPSRFIPMEQVEGIRIKSPTRNASTISKGVYHGHPPIPSEDISTIAENELLIAHADVPPALVAQLSTILFEDRKKLTNIAPMAAFIKQPQKDSEQLIPIHEGVRKFWERTEPPFLQRNADLIATVSSFLFVIFSVVMWARGNQRKRVMYEYNRRLMNLAFRIKNLQSADNWQSHSDEFDQFVIELVGATEKGEINTEDYTALSYTFEIVIDALNDKRKLLEPPHANPI